MNKDKLSSFAADVYIRLRHIQFPSEEDMYVDMTITDCFRNGFSIVDAAEYCRLMEHIQAYERPHLTEEYCLEQMARLSAKYNKTS